jgi:hypothetical protein
MPIKNNPKLQGKISMTASWARSSAPNRTISRVLSLRTRRTRKRLNTKITITKRPTLIVRKKYPSLRIPKRIGLKCMRELSLKPSCSK